MRDAFAAQAAADWEAILLHRARELVPGGQLVFANFGIDEAGRYRGATVGRNMHETFARHWRALYEDGTITSDELRRATFVQYYRTIAEFRAPFDIPPPLSAVPDWCWSTAPPCLLPAPTPRGLPRAGRMR